MIFVLVVIAVVILAFALPGPISELQRRRRSYLSRRHPTGRVRPRLGRVSDSYADWWPEFERQFRAYVRERDREAH
jgi:hypothetical protein